MLFADKTGLQKSKIFQKNKPKYVRKIYVLDLYFHSYEIVLT